MRRATLLLAIAAAFGLSSQLLFYRERLGLNFAVATILFLGFAWTTRTAGVKRGDIWMPAFALAFATFVAVRIDAAVVTFDILAVLSLALATTVSTRGVEVSRLRFPVLIAEALRAATAPLWRAVPTLRIGSALVTRAAPQLGGALPYLAGSLIAVPFVLLFAALFRAADPVFARSWEDLFDPARWWDGIAEARDRTIIAVAVAWFAAGTLADRDRASTPRARMGIGCQVATAFLVSIASLFAAFVYVQIAYLFGGRDTAAAASMTFSEYARRGFVELLAVAGLVGATLFAIELLVTRRSRIYLASLLSVIALTGVIVASSLYRLDLYQSAYGWSELRLYALAAIVAVAAGLAILVWSIQVGRTAFAMQPLVFVTLGIALIVNAVGPSGFVARTNIARSLDRSATDAVARLDPWHLVSLGHGALPDLVDLRSSLPDSDRRCLDYALYLRYRLEGAESSSWQSWNVDRERAREAIVLLKEVFSGVKPNDPGACRYAASAWMRTSSA
ncbi:MAG: DUF4173 domain-containing protein [Chloroflexi bacterium]|nr:DUF4173 domain-containing protein [Chloroflexota bacterium]